MSKRKGKKTKTGAKIGPGLVRMRALKQFELRPGLTIPIGSTFDASIAFGVELNGKGLAEYVKKAEV